MRRGSVRCRSSHTQTDDGDGVKLSRGGTFTIARVLRWTVSDEAELTPGVDADAGADAPSGTSAESGTGAGARRTTRQLFSLGVGLAACTAVVAVVGERRVPGAGLPWAVVAASGVAAVVGFAGLRADRNRPAEGRRAFESLGVANAVTLCRGALVAFLAGLLVVPTPFGWLPALLYGSVAALDALDGAIARLRGRTTLLGASLDMNVDAAGLLVAALVGVVAGSLPPWYLLVGVARYLFLLGERVRRRRGLPVFELPHSTTRRVLAGVQMATTAVALAPVVPRWAAWTLATATMLPFLGNFLRDWFVVSGRRERPFP